MIGGTNGRPKRADVGKLSHCYRCNEELLKGTTCIEIPQIGQAYSTARRVCNECFDLILSKTEDDLAKIRQLTPTGRCHNIDEDDKVCAAGRKKP